MCPNQPLKHFFVCVFPNGFPILPKAYFNLLHLFYVHINKYKQYKSVIKIKISISMDFWNRFSIFSVRQSIRLIENSSKVSIIAYFYVFPKNRSYMHDISKVHICQKLFRCKPVGVKTSFNLNICNYFFPLVIKNVLHLMTSDILQTNFIIPSLILANVLNWSF